MKKLDTLKREYENNELDKCTFTPEISGNGDTSI